MMDFSESLQTQRNPIEVMRDELRHITNTERKQHRAAEWNKRRVALGEVTNDEKSWDLVTIIVKAHELKKKPLPIEDYLKLQTALIQTEENIVAFLSVDNTIPALIRDISNANPVIKLAAIHCCCNITLVNSKHCSPLYKYAGPHLVRQLEILSNPLLEVSAWTIGNLCSGSKSAFKSLHAQGCISRLLSLLRECDTIILPSIIYAITHCLHGGSELISDAEVVEMSNILVERNCFEIASGLWALALLSSKVSCRETILSILSSLLDKFMLRMKDENIDTVYITAAIRLLANAVAEPSGSAADEILNNPKYSMEDMQRIFDKLLLYPYIHVRKETLWLIGNLYNHSQSKVNQRMLSLLPHLLNLKCAILSSS